MSKKAFSIGYRGFSLKDRTYFNCGPGFKKNKKKSSNMGTPRNPPKKPRD